MIFEYVGRTLARALQFVVMNFDVERIYVGGGISRAGDPLFTPLYAEWERQRKLSPLAASSLRDEMIVVVPSDYKAGVWGAIALAKLGLLEKGRTASSPRLPTIFDEAAPIEGGTSNYSIRS